MVFDEPIQSVCCNRQTASPVILIIIQLISEIQLYRLEIKERKLIYRSNYWLGNINTINFLSPLLVFAVAETNQLW